jgi:hypothetical protein
MTEQNEVGTNTAGDLNGLGGWLILVGLGVILAPILLGRFLYTIYRDLFSNGAWSLLTNVSSEYYMPHFGVTVGVESFINLGLFIVSLYLIYLFLSRNKFFPKLFIWLSFFSLVFIIVDAIAVGYVFPTEEAFDSETMREIGKASFRVVVWVPYMMVSKRVKATFIN